jgi:hypothetical protein
MDGRVARSLLLCLALSPACTQVLGLERAQLDEHGAAGSGASGSVQRPRAACQEAPGPDCAQCLAESCRGAEQSCAADTACRLELDRYAVCVGATCDASKQEDCSFDFTDPGLSQCITACAGECGARNPLSQCELYCACMTNLCESELPRLGADCVATCEALPAEVRDCRRDHCEIAQYDTSHCLHASDAQHVCLSHDELSAEDRSVCTDGKESTWGCERSSECCSEACLDGVCM